jgi:uncharacterized protein
MQDEAPSPLGDTAGGARPAVPLMGLLEVQLHDTSIDQLRHRRAALPERATLRQVESRLSSLEQRTKEVQTQRDELASRQADLEKQIESSKSRRAELERRMFGGQVSASRDLQAMDEETRHLGRHISELEDREIEVMEALEPLDGELQAGDSERDALENEAGRLRRAISEQEQSLDTDIAGQSAARASVAEGVPADLISRYEQLRKKLGGTGAARLVNGSCTGCHLALPAMEVDRIKRAPPDAIITCDQCGRILVR